MLETAPRQNSMVWMTWWTMTSPNSNCKPEHHPVSIGVRRVRGGGGRQTCNVGRTSPWPWPPWPPPWAPSFAWSSGVSVASSWLAEPIGANPDFFALLCW